MIVYRSAPVPALVVPPVATTKSMKLFKCSTCRDRSGRYGVHCSKCKGHMPQSSNSDGPVDLYV